MKKNITTILLVIGIVLFANLISGHYFFRLDLTEDHQYTLSNATRDILESLESPVTVRAYFSEELPPNISKTRNDFEELLIEYNRLSHNNILYKFINPNEDEKAEQQALQAGVQPVMINLREKDQIKQQKAFLGAVLELGEQKEVIPFIEPGAPLEYALSTAIKKMAATNKPAIAIIQGHGEPAIDELSQIHQGLNVMYQTEPVTLTASSPIPDKYKTAVIIRPTDTIPHGALQQLDAFLERGGNLMVAINRVDGNLQTVMGSAINTGLEQWLASKGLTVKNEFVVDAKCGTVAVQQQQGGFRYSTSINFPYIPIVSSFADHPITKGLEAVVMPFASPLEYTGDTTATFTPLAFTSQKSGTQKAPLYFNVQKQWNNSDFPQQRIPLAGLLEKQQANGNSWKIVVATDGDFAVNGPRGESRQLQADNINLMVNAIDWMSDDTGLIDLRTKGVQYRPLDEISEGAKTILKYLNFLLPILLLAAYGIIRMQINRNRRIKRMQESYE